MKLFSQLPSELKYEICGIALITTRILALISLLGQNVGPVGMFLAKIQKNAFGIGAPVLPLLLLAVGSRYIWRHEKINYSLKFWGWVSLYVLSLAIFHHLIIPSGQ